VHSGNKTLTLSPGRHLAITGSNVREFGEVNPIEAVGYRGISSLELGNGLRAFHAEFSIPSALGSIKSLRMLFNSKQAEAQKLSGHIAKTVAAMSQVRKDSERFQQVLRPRMAAFAPKE